MSIRYDPQPPHCLTAESYLGRRGCLMGTLTFQEISDPLTQRRRVIRFWDIIHSKAFLCKPDPLRKTRESEGPCSSAGSRGWPLASAERADSPSAEGGREFQREEGNASQCRVPPTPLTATE